MIGFSSGLSPPFLPTSPGRGSPGRGGSPLSFTSRRPSCRRRPSCPARRTCRSRRQGRRPSCRCRPGPDRPACRLRVVGLLLRVVGLLLPPSLLLHQNLPLFLGHSRIGC